jgi:uncharacterized protein (DUF1778 family)
MSTATAQRPTGRPQLPPHIKRSRRIRFAASPREAAVITAAADAAGHTVAEWLRTTALAAARQTPSA